MMFWLKKFVAFWLMPLPLCLTLLTVGWLMLYSRQRRALGRWLIGSGVMLLLLFSNKAVSTWLVRPLEFGYAAIPEFTDASPVPPRLAQCRYVVVLGGGHGDTVTFSAVNKLSTSAQGRLMEALRILRVLPEAKLVVTGPGLPNRPTHASVLAQAAVSLGVDPGRILQIDTARDTEEEAIAVRQMVKDQPVALVTSAWHLRRAMALMRQVGLDPVPCPSDFAARPSSVQSMSDYLWDTESLGRSTRAVYERIGYAWSKLRGKA